MNPSPIRRPAPGRWQRRGQRLVRTAIVACVLAMAGGAGAADDLLRRADDLMKEFSWREAYDALAPQESVRAGEYEYDLRLGRSAFNAEMYERSAEVFARIVAKDPDSPLGHFDLGRAYFILGNYVAAKQELERAKALLGRPDTLIDLTLYYTDLRLSRQAVPAAAGR